MSFKDRVEDLTSLDITDSPEATQFLQDGVKDIISRVIRIIPEEARLFETAETMTSNPSSIIDSGVVVSVTRGNGESGSAEPAEQINPSDRYRATDQSSLSYRSKYSPGWYLLNNKVSVIPTPTHSPNEAIVNYVKYPTPDITDTSIGSASNVTINISVNQANPAVFSAINTLTAGDVVSLSSFTQMTELNGITAIVSASGLTGTTFELVGIDSTNYGAAETTGGTALVSGSGFPEQYEPLACLYVAMKLINATLADISLPSNVLVAVPPFPPAAPSFNYSDVGESNALDTPIDLGDITAVPSVPVYTPPIVSNDGMTNPDLTDADDSVAYNTAEHWADFDEWWQIAGYIIENEEDPELAGVHLQKIQTYLNAYREQLGSNVQEFNAALEKYKAYIAVQKTEEELNLQRLMKKAEQDNQVGLQNAISNYKADFDMYEAEIKVYGTEVAVYDKEAMSQIQEYSVLVQGKQATYVWLQDQYNRFKVEYDEAFGLMRKPEPQKRRSE
tara:strand:- start:545 stop:2056 length:1512 start_codon:yes stop_codon:yes gene_type:complete